MGSVEKPAPCRETDGVDTRFLADEMAVLPPAYGAANVIMQLANPAVGYGVMESKVHSGNLYEHPIKRGRTTLTYIAVAIAGTARDREIYREAVNRVHVHVHSDAASPVRYNAFDPALQLWVAACMSSVFEDSRRLIRGGRTHADPDAIYQAASVFATMLQVPRAMWPANHEAFQNYWNSELEKVTIDEKTRNYLDGIARLAFLPRPVSKLIGGWNQFLALGFLPAQLREKLGHEWTAADQRRFEEWLLVFRVLDRLTPRVLMRVAMKAYVWDLRLRYVTGRVIV